MALVLTGISCGVPLSEGALYQKVRSQTLMLLNPDNHGSGGTGFVVVTPTGNRFTLTNAHVCRVTKRSWLDAKRGDAFMRLHVVMIADGIDLCLLDAWPGLEGLPVAQNSKMLEMVFIVGHPLLRPALMSRGYYIDRGEVEIYDNGYTEAECTGPGKAWKNIITLFGPVGLCAFTYDAGMTDATIRPGNSGSPVTNANGEVVGVVFAGDGVVGIFVPLDLLQKFLAGF